MTAGQRVQSDKITIACCACGAVRETKTSRLPQGWKRKQDAVYCAACWSQRYILRAISLPVASPLDCSWDDLRTALKLMWRQTTAAANRIMTECYASDVRRTGVEREKMPPMPKTYLYPILRAEFPALPSQTVASLEHACVAKYRSMRYQVIWTGAAALPTYRYPTPFPIPAQGWTARLEDGKPIVSVRIGERRMELRLKNGPQFRRQYAAIRLLAQGEAQSGEAAIYQRGDALMVKLVAWLPRGAAHEASGTLTVRTANDCLLLAVNAKDETLWRYNGDHLRRWVAQHRQQLQRWSEDAKYENRPVPSFAARRDATCRKFRDRMDSATHEIAAQLAGYAERRRFASVEYNDSCRDYVPDFPYFRLASLIHEKLDARGIELIASGPSESDPPEALATQD